MRPAVFRRAIDATNGLFGADTAVYRAPNDVWLAAGIAGLITYAILKISLVKISLLAEALLIISFIASFAKAPATCRRDPLFYYLIASLALSLMVFFLIKIQEPKYDMGYPHLEHLARPALIMVVAWWLGGSERNVMRLYGLAFGGLLFAVMYHFNASAFTAGISPGGRLDYGIRNAGHTAAYLGVALIGWVAFSGYFLSNAHGKKLWLKSALWGGVFLWLIWSLVMTQTRAAWLGLGLVLLVVIPFYFIIKARTRDYTHFRKLALIILITAIPAAIIAYHGAQRISERVDYEMDTVHGALGGRDIKNVEMNSIGVRIHMWVEASQWIAQRPLTGWGDVGHDAVIKESPDFDEAFKIKYGHLHNSFIEILVLYGALGLTLVLGLFAWIYWCLWKSWKKRVLPDALFLFSIGFIVFWITVNMFESFFIFSTGTYIDAIILGGLYSFCLVNRQRESHL